MRRTRFEFFSPFRCVHAFHAWLSRRSYLFIYTLFCAYICRQCQEIMSHDGNGDADDDDCALSLFFLFMLSLSGLLRPLTLTFIWILFHICSDRTFIIPLIFAFLLCLGLGVCVCWMLVSLSMCVANCFDARNGFIVVRYVSILWKHRMQNAFCERLITKIRCMRIVHVVDDLKPKSNQNKWMNRAQHFVFLFMDSDFSGWFRCASHTKP